MNNQVHAAGNADAADTLEAGKVWATRELHSLAVQRNVRLDNVVWTNSLEAKTFIVEINSSAGEHTISISHEILNQCSHDESRQIQLRDRLSGLIGDLARIERRGSLR